MFPVLYIKLNCNRMEDRNFYVKHLQATSYKAHTYIRNIPSQPEHRGSVFNPNKHNLIGNFIGI